MVVKYNYNDCKTVFPAVRVFIHHSMSPLTEDLCASASGSKGFLLSISQCVNYRPIAPLRQPHLLTFNSSTSSDNNNNNQLIDTPLYIVLNTDSTRSLRQGESFLINFDKTIIIDSSFRLTGSRKLSLVN